MTTTTAHTMRIVCDAITPTGQPGLLIECTCATHKPGASRAIVRAVARPGLTADPDRIHGYVALAWHPALSRAPQVRRDGPWQA